MKIGIATDHHGVEIKKELLEYLKASGYEVINYGTDSTDMVDYPEYAIKVGEEVVNGKINYGILLCGTGIGMSIACNKVKGVRCAKVDSLEEAKLTREHNDANVLALNSSISKEKMKEIIRIFLNTSFLGERHLRRVEKIRRYEDER